MTAQLESKKDKNLKSLRSYVVGFVISLLLTLIAFYITSHHSLDAKTLTVMLMVLALVQLIIQVVFFLRLNATEEGRWSLMPFLFTILIVLVLVIGSLWIMINLNYNMMH